MLTGVSGPLRAGDVQIYLVCEQLTAKAAAMARLPAVAAARAIVLFILSGSPISVDLHVKRHTLRFLT